MFRRGELIPDAAMAQFIIESGRNIMHEKTVLCPAQSRRKSVGWIIEKVRERKLYRCLPVSV